MRRKAVLIIHGFGGGTYDLEELANYLEFNKELDVYTFTLPGHDIRIKAHSKRYLWVKKSEEQIERLIKNGYTAIYVIGHSMGGLIACHLATKYRQTKKLILLAPAFESFASIKGNFDIRKALKTAHKVVENYTLEELIGKANKMPSGAVRELFLIMREYRELVKEINIPTLIIHGKQDLVVPVESSIEAFKELKTKRKKLILVENLNHELFKNNNRDDLKKLVNRFCNVYSFTIKEEKIEI